MIHTLRPWQISLTLHLGLFLAFLALTKMPMIDTEVIDVPVVFEAPKDIQNLTL